MIRTCSFDGLASMPSRRVHGFASKITPILALHFAGLFSILFPILTSAATAGARTLNGFDLSSASIPAEEIVAGGPPRDGIAALDAPRVEPVESGQWSDDERILGISVGGESRAYPVAILDWHELVNDTLGGRPIVVSYCPLCGTGMVFDRRVGDEVRRFGVSGLLYRSDVLMFDRESQSLWSQIKAEAVTGPLRGERLTLLRSSMDDWGNWRRAHPESTILSRATGYVRNYDRPPYAGYAESRKLYFPAPHDRRYHPKTLTLGIRIAGRGARAYPAPEVEKAGGSVAEEHAGRRIVVSYDARRGVFEVAAPEDVEIVEGYWFAWAAFHPETTVFEAARPGRVRPSCANEVDDSSFGGGPSGRGRDGGRGSSMSKPRKPSRESDEMTIGALARGAGVPISTVRYYERTGIFRARDRSAGNYRLYSHDDLQRLRFIRAAQAIGFTLEDIAHLLRPTSCERVEGMLEARIEAVETRMKALRHVRGVLRKSLERCRDHEEAGCCAVVAELSQRAKRR